MLQLVDYGAAGCLIEGLGLVGSEDYPVLGCSIGSDIEADERNVTVGRGGHCIGPVAAVVTEYPVATYVDGGSATAYLHVATARHEVELLGTGGCLACHGLEG